tara:strand:- start:1105 stop:1524 length:420 start_codon:yes stop_codon:yes gene_type:complete
MSTRSEIAIENKDGSINSIYCHSDGYIENNGYLLNKHYKSHKLALSIIKENDCSYLGKSIDESRFYNTWRNENTKAKKFKNESCFMQDFNNDIFAEYIYLFKNNKWYVSQLKMLDNPNDNYGHCISYHTKFILLDDIIN